MYRKSGDRKRGLHNPQDVNAQPSDVHMVLNKRTVRQMSRVIADEPIKSVTQVETPLSEMVIHLNDAKVCRWYGPMFKRAKDRTIILTLKGAYCERVVTCAISIAHKEGWMLETLAVQFSLKRIKRHSYVVIAPSRWMNKVIDQLAPITVC